MKRNEIVRNANREEAEKAMRDIVIELYGGFNQTPAEQTIGQSVKEIMDAVSSTMTGEDVYNILNTAADNTENRQLYPKWFSKQLRTTSQGTNQAQDFVETKYPAPSSNGSYDLDTKCDFMAMWAQVYFTTAFKERHQIGANWDIQYRFLVKHGMMAEPEGWLDVWKKRAVERIKAKMLADGTPREIIDSRNAMKQALDNNTEIMNTVYKIRVKELVYRSQKLSPDEFSNRFNAATPELPAVFIIQDNSKEHFHLELRKT